MRHIIIGLAMRPWLRPVAHSLTLKGVRSTPVRIVSDGMVIGIFPYGQLRAIFQALADRERSRKFIENWQETGK